MFYTSQAQIHHLKKGVLKSGISKSGVPEDDDLPDQDTLKQHCLESASLWVLKRRANLPHMRPRSLPAVARGG